MKIKKFIHQLGEVTVRIYSDGTATFNKKRFRSYQSARRALTTYYGFVYEAR